MKYADTGTKNFIVWPSKEDIQETMTPAFKIHYPNCRVIIDICFSRDTIYRFDIHTSF